MKDITDMMLASKKRGGLWTESVLKEVIADILNSVPGSEFDWDPGDGEKWVTFLRGEDWYAELRSDFPFLAIEERFERLVSRILPDFLSVLVVDSLSDKEFKIRQAALPDLFGPWAFYSDVVDIERFSITDLVYTTVSD